MTTSHSTLRLIISAEYHFLGGPPPPGFIDPVIQPAQLVDQPVTLNLTDMQPNSEPGVVVMASGVCPFCRVIEGHVLLINLKTKKQTPLFE